MRPKSRSSKAKPAWAAILSEGIVVALCLGAAILLTWPLTARLDQGIPLGTESVATVPLTSLWSLWWNGHQVSAGYSGYWDAPIFHPTARAFALSESHAVQGALAGILYPLLRSWPATYNLLLLLTLTLNGWTASRLLRFLGTDRSVSIAGSILVIALPFVHQELGVFALVQIWGVILSLLSALRFVRTRSVANGALLGAAVGASYLLCGYYGVMSAILLGLVLPFLLGGRLRELGTWKGVVTGSLVCALLVLPIALPQRGATEAQGLKRSERTVAKHSAKPHDYLEAAWPTVLPAPAGSVDKPSERAFWPGTSRVILAILGLVWMLRRPRRRWGLALVGIGALGGLLSLGPHGALGSFSSYDMFRTLLPGYGQMRALFRFAVVPQLVVTLLSACGIQACLNFRPGERSARINPAPWIALGLALFAIADLRPRMGPIQPLPPLTLDLAWVEWIEEETPESAVLAFLPFPTGRSSADYLGTTQWMYWQMRHGRKMVNGYSSFFPQSFRDLKGEMAGFPSEAALDLLAEHGVGYIVVHRAFFPRRLDDSTTAPERLTYLAGDDATGIDIYRLR